MTRKEQDFAAWKEKDRAFQEQKRREMLAIRSNMNAKHAAALASVHDEKGRARDARYNATEKGHARRARYEASDKGRAMRERYEGSIHRRFASTHNSIRRSERRCDELRAQLGETP